MKNKMPRRLHTIKHNGKEYFIDWRLKEFRPVERPFESIPFNSELGREIDEMPGNNKMKTNPIEDNVNITCPKCRKMLFTGTKKEARQLIIYCEDCLR